MSLLKNYARALIFLLGLSAGAQAIRITGNSDYGITQGKTPVACSSITYSGVTFSCNGPTGGNITAEAFTASSFDSSATPADFLVFDFEVHGAVPGQSLVLNVGGSIPPDPDASAGFYSYGVFGPCVGGDSTQCTSASDTLKFPTNYCDNGTCNSKVFPLFGTNPVFFVVVQDTRVCTDPDDSSTCTSPAVTITASITTITLSVSRTKLYFGYSNALITSPQTVTVSISGGLNVGWTASSDHANVMVSPPSGNGSGTFQVTASPPSGGGSTSAVITVSASGATGSPQQVQVNVTSVTPTVPYGNFDTPVNNASGIAGAVGVTGWALDGIEVTNVGIWRAPVPGEATASNGLVFIGNANFVADARPDVAAAFPAAPYQYRGGWGYQMLTNFLPNAAGSGPPGSGTYVLHAIITNASGRTADLGTRTIIVNNAQATLPFGTIDTPDQGGTATGNAFVNFGWALAQKSSAIPLDGSTITVILDGVAVGHPAYNQFRSDIANLFPGYANSNGAVGFFFIDTTKLQNAVHTISWNAFDSAGRGAGLGSRYFSVLNAGGGGVAAPAEAPTPESLAGPVRLRSGYDPNAPEAAIGPDAAGSYSIEMEQLGRIELSLGASKGYQVVGNEAAGLPLGSSLKAGTFYWQAPLGFLGKYEMVFERPDGTQIRVLVNILPMRYSVQ